MNKSYRHGQILNVIRTRTVRTQDDLSRALRSTGIDAAQGTLSRDIRELGLVKTPQGYAIPGNGAATPHGPGLATVTREFLLDIHRAQQLLVLKTPPGHASSLAEALDQAGWPEVAGTIAGENTVLVVTQDSKTAAALRKKLLALVA
jgi:transcriptional regulator of arginine metabolism